VSEISRRLESLYFIVFNLIIYMRVVCEMYLSGMHN